MRNILVDQEIVTAPESIYLPYNLRSALIQILQRRSDLVGHSDHIGGYIETVISNVPGYKLPLPSLAGMVEMTRFSMGAAFGVGPKPFVPEIHSFNSLYFHTGGLLAATFGLKDNSRFGFVVQPTESVDETTNIITLKQQDGAWISRAMLGAGFFMGGGQPGPLTVGFTRDIDLFEER
jgi:hypothetical protein